MKKKYFIIAAAVICLLFSGGYVWIKDKIEQIISEKAATAGITQYKKLEISLFQGDIFFEGAVFNRAFSKQSFNIAFPKISAEGLSWWKMYRSKKLNLDRLLVESPQVSMIGIEKDSFQTPADTSSSESLASLNIGQILVTDGAFDFFQNEADSIPKLQSDTFNIDLKEIYFTKENNDGLPTIEDAICSFRKISSRTEKDYHSIIIQEITCNKKDSLLELSGLTISPKFGKRAFFQQLKYKMARLDMTFPKVSVKGWRFDKILNKALVARAVEVPNMDLQIMANDNLTIDPNRYKPLPHEALVNAPFGISIDSIVVEEGRLFLELIAKGKSEIGSLSFDPLRGVFTNVTNDSARIARSNMMELNAVGYVKGKHPFHNHFWMDLASPEYVFSFSGNLKQMPFSALNSFLEPSSNVRFNNGEIQVLDFEVNADQSIANGNLIMEYDNLDFSILDEKNKNKKLLSKLASIFLINNENNEMKDDIKEGNVYAKRDTIRAFFTFWWESIQSGMKSILLHGPIKKSDKK